MKPKYLVGNALEPDIEGICVIGHVCNDRRVMGAGIALAIAKKWPWVEAYYKNAKTCNQGEVQLVQVDFEPSLAKNTEDLFVLNMIAQSLGKNSPDGIPLNYSMLEFCLDQAAIICNALNATFVGPRFGAGLAGGDWNVIEKIIDNAPFNKQPVIYDVSPMEKK